jgi:hypothetical protein
MNILVYDWNGIPPHRAKIFRSIKSHHREIPIPSHSSAGTVFDPPVAHRNPIDLKSVGAR